MSFANHPGARQKRDGPTSDAADRPSLAPIARS